jgi:hypothetical protein
MALTVLCVQITRDFKDGATNYDSERRAKSELNVFFFKKGIWPRLSHTVKVILSGEDGLDCLVCGD